MAVNKRVVITGTGIVSAIGYGTEIFWENIIKNTSGIKKNIGKYQRLLKYGAYTVASADEESFQNIKNIKGYRRMPFAEKMIIDCTTQAIKESKLEKGELLSTGIILGVGPCYEEGCWTEAYNNFPPTTFFHTYPSAILGDISKHFNMHGSAFAITNACCSATQAIGEAFHKIRDGQDIIILAGGTDDKMNQYCVSGFQRLGMLSAEKNEEKAMRPFDDWRDGLVIGQGAGTLMLEEYEHAKARNADILGEIVGYGSSIDGKSIADASVKGKIMGMELALKDANIDSSSIGYINAHGTSTYSNDFSEAKAIECVFKERSCDIPVSSTKSFIGHTFAACGAIQSCVCIYSLRDQLAHANRNYVGSNETKNINVIKYNTMLETDFCMTNTSGIGGCNVSLIYRAVK